MYRCCCSEGEWIKSNSSGTNQADENDRKREKKGCHSRVDLLCFKADREHNIRVVCFLEWFVAC